MLFHQIYLASFMALVLNISTGSAEVLSPPSPCDDGNTCHHQCELEKMNDNGEIWYNVWCHCFEGYRFSGKTSSEGYEECEPICSGELEFWDPIKKECTEVLTACIGY